MMSSVPDLYSYFLNLLLLGPLVVAIQKVFPYSRVVRLVLIVVGIYALFGAAPRFVLFFLAYWCCVWLLQFPLECSIKAGKRSVATAMTASVIIVALSPMVLWKIVPALFTPWMTTFFSQSFWKMFPQAGYVDALVGLVEPIGLSFTVFRAIDLLIKVRLELLGRLSLERVLFFGLFPPVLALGPIIEYEEVRVEGRFARATLPGDLAVGAFRFALGSLKIFLFAYALERFAAWLWQGGAGATWQIWISLFAFGAYFYLNFSGYSDLSIGVARVYGFRLKENFNNPYFKTNPQAFWNSWHMSLTRWAQRYVFIPLGGMRRGRQYFAIFMTIMTIALWHGITWPLVIYGAYHGLIMVGYRWVVQHPTATKRTLEVRWVRYLKMSAVFIYVSVALPLLSLATDEMWPFYRLLIPGLH